MRHLSVKLKSTLLVLLTVLFLFPSLLPAHNCDFAAVMTKDGVIIPDLNRDSQLTLDNPPDYYYDFVTSRSTASTNDDGYGIVYCKDGQSYIPRATQTWYSFLPFSSSPWQFINARSAIQTPANEAVMVMSHARNGTGGLPGNHPFTFDYNKRTYAFMHNGFIIDDGNANNIKEALWNELYNHYGDRAGDWFREHPSNWVDFADTDDYDNFIDSELVFHWIMKNIIEQNNNTFNGLHAALTETTLRCPAGSAYRSINLNSQLINNVAANKLNFVMFDGENLWIYRNTPISGNNYNLSYKEFSFGMVGIKTQETVGTQLDQFTMVKVTRDGSPMEFEDFPTRHYADLSVQVFDSPDPVMVGTTLNYQIMISNNGPHDAGMVRLYDVIPAIIQNPVFTTMFNSLSTPWQNDAYVFNGLPAYTSTVINIKGRISSNFVPSYIDNTALVHEIMPMWPIYNPDPNPANNSVTERTTIVWGPIQETPKKTK